MVRMSMNLYANTTAGTREIPPEAIDPVGCKLKAASMCAMLRVHDSFDALRL